MSNLTFYNYYSPWIYLVDGEGGYCVHVFLVLYIRFSTSILITLHYNYEMSKEGALGFSISNLALEIFKLSIYEN